MADTSYTKGIGAASVAALLVAAFVLLTPGEKAATRGVTRHGELAVAVDGGAADVVGVTGVTPGTPAQVLTLSDAGVPTWRAPAASTPTTTLGDLVTHGDAGATRLAIGADGSVLTSLAGRAQWAAAGGGGPAAGSGTYASRPGTCAIGDSYTVTSGQRVGSLYRCALTDTWEIERVLAPTTVMPSLQWDAERVGDLGAAANVITWRDERASATLSLASNRTAAPTIGTASYGSIAPVAWGANSGSLRSVATGPTWAMPRTLIVVLASVDGSADRAWVGWGGSSGVVRTFCLRTRSTGSGGTTGLSFYGTDPWGTGAMPTTTTPTILSARYSGTQYALRQASLSGLAWSYSLAATTAGLNTYGIGAASGTLSGIVVGASAWDTGSYDDKPARGELYAILVYPAALSEAQEEAIGTAYSARFGP